MYLECRTLKQLPVKFARSQAGALQFFIQKLSSVKDGLVVVEQGGNVGLPSPHALQLHFITTRFFNLV